MMLLQQSNFCVIPSSQFPLIFSQSFNQRQRNPLLHQQKFSFNLPKKAKASTFRISSLGAGFFNDVAQIAHNKVPLFHFCFLYVLTNSGFLSSFYFYFFIFLILFFKHSY
jgi:hypothetical protein